jgi:hypothetical protein
MIRKNLILPVAAAVCFLVPATTVFAQDATTTTQSTKKVKPAKTVKFTVSNQTNAPVSLKAGDQQMTIAAGQSQSVKAQSGQQIVTTSDSAVGAAGTVVASVTDTMEGATVNVRQ